MYGVSTKASPNAFFFTRNIHVDHDVLDLTRRQKLEPLALSDQVPHQRFAHLSNVVRTFASPLSEFICIYPFVSPIGFHKEENIHKVRQFPEDNLQSVHLEAECHHGGHLPGDLVWRR